MEQGFDKGVVYRLHNSNLSMSCGDIEGANLYEEGELLLHVGEHEAIAIMGVIADMFGYEVKKES